MEIKEITDKNTWEGFWASREEKTFLQSWNWGEFWQKMGNKIWRLEGMLAVKVAARRGTFLLVQHNVGISEALLDELKKIAKEEKCDFIRMAPLIRQAQNNPDITVEKSDSADSLEIYQKLNKEVAKRQNFTPFSEEYIKNEFEVFFGNGQALWLFGKYKGEVAAGVLVIFWSEIGFYHQAASLSKYAKLSIPYLLQWEAIKEAKRRGCTLYDFWGYVDPQKNPKHPWAGPTLFKMGFGGRAYEYIKTQDYPLS